jgi:Na+-transporting NADH:ubiquinone oxidoreductase subunit NqrC
MAMSKALKATVVILVGMFAVMIVVGIFLVSTYVQYKNAGARIENQLTAELDKNRTVLNNVTMKVKEMAQVPDMYVDGLKTVIAASMSGRYGDKGSQATVQWIKEQNIPFDTSLYTKIQQAQESGRNDFMDSQQKMVDIARVYKNQLDFVWSGFWLHLVGYPKVNLDDFKPVIADSVDVKFKTHKDEVIKLHD